jgi:hypothetical protein
MHTHNTGSESTQLKVQDMTKGVVGQPSFSYPQTAPPQNKGHHHSNHVAFVEKRGAVQTYNQLPF